MKFAKGERVRADGYGRRLGTVVDVPDRDRFYVVEFSEPTCMERAPFYEFELRPRPLRALREAAATPAAAALAGACAWLVAWLLDSLP